MIKEQKFWGLSFLLSDPINGLEGLGYGGRAEYISYRRRPSFVFVKWI